MQETFIRAWRHLPQLTADERPVRPWLFRVARNLLIDADRAARARPLTVPGQPAEDSGPDAGLDQVLDRQLLAGALQQLSPTRRAVLVETFYHGSTPATLARQLGIPPGTARSRLHYALHALRQQLEDPGTAAAGSAPGRPGIRRPAGGRGETAGARPGRLLITVLLGSAAALDLTRCGIVLGTAGPGQPATGLGRGGPGRGRAEPGRGAGLLPRPALGRLGRRADRRGVRTASRRERLPRPLRGAEHRHRRPGHPADRCGPRHRWPGH